MIAPLRTLADVLGPSEQRVLVAWLCEVARDLGAERDASVDAIAVLREASDLARWVGCGACAAPWGTRIAVLATALATDAGTTATIAANACRAARGAKVERWTA